MGKPKRVIVWELVVFCYPSWYDADIITDFSTKYMNN